MIAGQGWPARNVAGALATALIYGAVRGWEHQEVNRYPVRAAT